MKGAKGKVGVILLVALMMGGVARAGKLPPAPKVDLPFFVYSDRGAAEAGYDFAPSGWMGNTDAIEYNDCADDPYFGDCCIEVIFDDRSWGFLVPLNLSANSRVRRISGQRTELNQAPRPLEDPPSYSSGSLFGKEPSA